MTVAVDLRAFDTSTERIRVETDGGDTFDVYVAGASFDPANGYSKGYVHLTLEGPDWDAVEEAAGEPVDRAILKARQRFAIGSGDPKPAKLYAYEELDSPGDEYTETEVGVITSVETAPDE